MVNVKLIDETTFNIIMGIRDNPNITKKELMDNNTIGCSHTIFIKIKELERTGIVKHIQYKEKKRGMANVHHLYLTDKGQVIASLLMKLQNELSKNEV